MTVQKTNTLSQANQTTNCEGLEDKQQKPKADGKKRGETKWDNEVLTRDIVAHTHETQHRQQTNTNKQRTLTYDQ